jgi:hypothetical protein
MQNLIAKGCQIQIVIVAGEDCVPAISSLYHMMRISYQHDTHGSLYSQKFTKISF